MSEHFEPIGQRFIDANSGKEMILVTEGNAEGWVCYRHPDGQWVTHRLARDDDRKAIELATLRERVKELEACKSLVALDQLIKITEQNIELKARIRDLEEAMPDVKTIEKISNEFGNDVGDHDHFFYVLRKMASRIESVMTKQPEEKNE